MTENIKPDNIISIQLLNLVSKFIFWAAIILSFTISSVLLYGTISRSDIKSITEESNVNSDEIKNLKMDGINIPYKGKHTQKFKNKLEIKYCSFISLPISKRLTILFSTLLILSLIVLCTYFFKRFMNLINKGLYFETYTIRNLRTISYLILFIWLVKFISWIFQSNGIVHPLNNFHISNSFPSINLLIASLSLWVLSYVFLQGAELKKEKELTI